MERVSVYCISTSKDAQADVLERSNQRIKVVLVGTTLTIVLTRTRTDMPYVGRVGIMEFETFGTQED